MDIGLKVPGLRIVFAFDDYAFSGLERRQCLAEQYSSRRAGPMSLKYIIQIVYIFNFVIHGDPFFASPPPPMRRPGASVAGGEGA